MEGKNGFKYSVFKRKEKKKKLSEESNTHWK